MPTTKKTFQSPSSLCGTKTNQNTLQYRIPRKATCYTRAVCVSMDAVYKVVVVRVYFDCLPWWVSTEVKESWMCVCVCVSVCSSRFNIQKKTWAHIFCPLISVWCEHWFGQHSHFFIRFLHWKLQVFCVLKFIGFSEYIFLWSEIWW